MTMHRDIRNVLAADFDGDRWGSAMSAWFDVADVIYHEGGPIPSSWQYRHSPLCKGTEAYARFGFAAHHAPLAAFYHAGEVLARYTETLERRGESY